MNSKEKFLETALDLFSRFGYSGVSVRDIAKSLNMRESAMYKHYESKAHILESIILRAKEKLEVFHNELKIFGQSSNTKEVVRDFFVKVFSFYTEDEFMNKFRKLMIISQYENTSTKERYQKMFVEKSLRYYEEIFIKIAKEKNENNVDCQLMAYELYSVLYILMQQYDCMDKSQQIELAKKLLGRHIDVFFSRYSFLEDK